MRYLVIAHAHPDFSVGGGEIAAHNLYQTLRDDPATTAATFLARTDLASIGVGAIVTRRPGEYLWRQDMWDWFKLRTAYPTAVVRNFREFLRTHRPDTVYVHHYAHIGLEILREIRDLGFEGVFSTEWTGFNFIDEPVALDQIRAQQDMVARLWSAGA